MRPLASFAPAGGLAEATTEQLALIAVAGLIALKFVINVAYGLVRLGQP